MKVHDDFKVELKTLLLKCGFVIEVGHLQKDGVIASTSKAVKIRVKLQDISVRIDYKPEGYSNWYRADGAFYKAINVLPDGSGVKIGRHFFKVRQPIPVVKPLKLETFADYVKAKRILK